MQWRLEVGAPPPDPPNFFSVSKNFRIFTKKNEILQKIMKFYSLPLPKRQFLE